MKYYITYTVTGFGQFPIDMLRYDRSFPAEETQSGIISRTFSEGEPWTVRLACYGHNKTDGPTEGRWESFCCKVKDVEASKL